MLLRRLISLLAYEHLLSLRTKSWSVVVGFHRMFSSLHRDTLDLVGFTLGNHDNARGNVHQNCTLHLEALNGTSLFDILPKRSQSGLPFLLLCKMSSTLG